MVDDLTKIRMIQTKDGVARIPREQQGVPIREFFQNVEMPADLDRAVVYATASGPVLGKPDPQPWNEQHEQKVTDYAQRVMGQIEERGYYSKTLNNYASRWPMRPAIPGMR